MSQNPFEVMRKSHPTWFPSRVGSREQPQIAKPKPAPSPPNQPLSKQGMTVELRPVTGQTKSGLFHAGQPIRFQCPPTEPFTITRGHDSQEFETPYNGTFSVAAAPKLDQIHFQTLILEDEQPWMTSPGVDVDILRHTLESLSRTGTPFHLLCVHFYRPTPEWSGMATLTDYIHTENEPLTYTADVTFKEAPNPEMVAGSRGPTKTWPQYHKLTATDTIYSLARKYYGKTSMARSIALANGIKNAHYGNPVVKLGGKWKTGKTIKLPEPAPKPTVPVVTH